MVQPSEPSVETSSRSLTWLAKFVSDVINPVFSGIFAVVLAVLHLTEQPGLALIWLTLMLVVAAVPPLGYVIYLVKTGYLADIHMPDRDKRIKPISIIFLWLSVTVVFLYILDAPNLIILMLEAAVVQIVLLWLITLLWKVSFHSATIASAATLAVLFRSDTALIVTVLVPVVAWARVYLNRHTVMQVIVGALAGIVVAGVAFAVIMTLQT